ncbi:exodeoxyribonuclease VII small subunit [uncultured Microbacterium sp.]|uniref:exodeoxyribonuclease VII small subunit n=1 Tax=uncultured Microbacterium sp. TaxID=191216 RepID=UPI0035CB6B8E
MSGSDQGGTGVSTVPSTEVATLSFEQARDELVRVVAELEQGAPTLEESLALWERGEALAARCEDWLLGAKRRLDAARGAAAPQNATTQGAGA